MDVKVEKLEKSMAKITVTLEPEKVDEAIVKAYHKVKNQISMPGFRKGQQDTGTGPDNGGNAVCMDTVFSPAEDDLSGGGPAPGAGNGRQEQEQRRDPSHLKLFL